jgi:hypothetical protein
MANKQTINQTQSVAALFDDTFEPNRETAPSEILSTPHAEPTPAAEDPSRPPQICGLKVHPAANEFPMLSGNELREFVASVRQAGQLMPVVVDNGVLLEGRNRARAVEILQAEGMDIELEERTWFPASVNETPTQFILATNLHRRHLTNDQRVMIAAKLVPHIEKELAEKQARSRIQPGEKRNPTGTNQHVAKSDPPSSHEADPKTANKKKLAASTRGQIAKQAGVSAYKANQAVRAAKAAPSEDIEAVIAGKKKLAEVSREISTEKAGAGGVKAKKARKPIAHPFMPADDFEYDVLKFWTQLVEQKLGVTEKARARDVLLRIFAAEEKAEKAPADSGKKPASGEKPAVQVSAANKPSPVGVAVKRSPKGSGKAEVKPESLRKETPLPTADQQEDEPTPEATPNTPKPKAKSKAKKDELEGIIHPRNLWGKVLRRSLGGEQS